MKSALILIALAGVAHADDEVPELALPARSAQVGVTVLQHFADRKDVGALGTVAPDPTITQIGLFGARFSFMAGNRVVGNHVAADIAIGGQIGKHSGFAYDVGVLPLGIGVRFGDDSFVALDTGLAAMGATGSLDDAMLLPFQLEVEAGTTYHVMGRARVSAVFGADGRTNGAPSLPIGDELEAMLGMRIGKSENMRVPMGYFLGVAYKEMQGTRYVGLSLGYAIGGVE